MTPADWFPGSRSPASDSALSRYFLTERASASALVKSQEIFGYAVATATYPRARPPLGSWLPARERSR